MRYSRRMLTLKYLNREEYFGALLPLGFFGTLATIAMLLYFASDFQLLLRGQTTQAIVREKFIAGEAPRIVVAQLFAHGGRPRGPSPQFRYDYVVAGKNYSGTSIVSSALWQQAAIGQQVEVLYAPNNPANQRLGNRWSLLWPLCWGFIPMFIALGCWALAYYSLRAGIRNVLRQVDLVCDGAAALAIVDAYEIKRGRKGRTYVGRFAYTYLVADENRQQHLEKVEEGTDIPFQPVAAGDVLLVLYDPQNPARHTIDRFNARAEDKQRLEQEAERLAAQTP